MELTGQAKKDFEKWFEVNPENSIGLKKEQLGRVKAYQLNLFYQLTDSMQYGVLVDFFDSVDIEVRANGQKQGDGFKYYESFTNGYLGAWSNRLEARTKAIEKANELYNKKFS